MLNPLQGGPTHFVPRGPLNSNPALHIIFALSMCQDLGDTRIRNAWSEMDVFTRKKRLGRKYKCWGKHLGCRSDATEWITRSKRWSGVRGSWGISHRHPVVYHPVTRHHRLYVGTTLLAALYTQKHTYEYHIYNNRESHTEVNTEPSLALDRSATTVWH